MFILEIQEWFNIHKQINITNYANELKDGNHIAIWLDAEKIFDKNPTSLPVKSPD